MSHSGSLQHDGLVALQTAPSQSSSHCLYPLPGAADHAASPLWMPGWVLLGSRLSVETQRGRKMNQKGQHHPPKKEQKKQRIERKKTTKVCQHCEGPSGLGHRWCSACSLEPRGEPSAPELRRGNRPYSSSSFSSTMGTAGRIWAAWCRLLAAAFWSTKLFWSGIVSVVSWVSE